MRLRYTKRFQKSYQAAPKSVQRAFDRKLALFLRDYRHPSLNAKKYDRKRSIWKNQAEDGETPKLSIRTVQTSETARCAN